MTVRYLSLFSGVDAASLAWEPLGWECVGFSEIEKHPCKVLKARWPNVPNLGDVTKITEDQIAALGRIDVVVFGSPCQDLSLAGKRKGFDGERSGLFFDAMRLVRFARRWGGCRFALWENVFGAFSSNQGRDFAAVVAEMAGFEHVDVPVKGKDKKAWGNEGCAAGEHGLLEWSTLDAQWFGVAQRRRRVFALADFGDWPNRPPILLEPESLRGDSAPSRKTGERVASTLGSSPSTSCCPNVGSGQGTVAARNDQDTASLLVFNSNAQVDQMSFDPHVTSALTCSQYAAVAQVSGTLTQRMGEGFNGQDAYNDMLVAQPMQVRRLTPIECERLQGMPDNHTNVVIKGKPSPDGPRYKAIGNSMAVPVVRWIGKRIDFVLRYY